MCGVLHLCIPCRYRTIEYVYTQSYVMTLWEDLFCDLMVVPGTACEVKSDLESLGWFRGDTFLEFLYRIQFLCTETELTFCFGSHLLVKTTDGSAGGLTSDSLGKRLFHCAQVCQNIGCVFYSVRLNIYPSNPFAFVFEQK